MDDISKKRESLIAAYSGSPNWRRKVINMSDTQVIAVYMRLLKEGKV